MASRPSRRRADVGAVAGELDETRNRKAAEMTDLATIKRAAAGRWPAILADVGGIPREFCTSMRKEGPCPKCQGNTRFRGIDEAAGALFCSHCFSKGNGDGLIALQWYTGKPFPEVVRMVADYFGISNGSSLRQEQGQIEFREAGEAQNLRHYPRHRLLLRRTSRKAVRHGRQTLQDVGVRQFPCPPL